MSRETKKLAFLPKNGRLSLHQGNGFPCRRFGIPEKRGELLSPSVDEDYEWAGMFGCESVEFNPRVMRRRESGMGTKPAA